MKQEDVLLLKGDIQLLNQKRDMDYFFLLNVQERSVKVLEGEEKRYGLFFPIECTRKIC